MKGGGSAARSPLFLRIFLLMLACVAVVQLMNLALLVAAQTPSAKLYTVGQIEDALARGRDPSGDFKLRRVSTVAVTPWNPRVERIGGALAAALGVAEDKVRISFPTALLQRERVYVPPPHRNTGPPLGRAAARDVVVTGGFSAALQQPGGSWIQIEPAEG